MAKNFLGFRRLMLILWDMFEGLGNLNKLKNFNEKMEREVFIDFLN